MRLAPFQVYLPGLARGRELDLIFIATRIYSASKTLIPRVKPIWWWRSPPRAAYGTGWVYAEYKAAGARKYWIVDLDERRADFPVLMEDHL